MGTLLQLGQSYAEVEERKHRANDSANAATAQPTVSVQTETAKVALTLVRDTDATQESLFVQRIESRKIVLQDLPARVLVDGDWMSVDLIDMGVHGFSFEVDRIMGAMFRPGQRLVFSLRIPELREFTLYGRIRWTRFDEVSRQTRCGVEIIEVHGPGGGISIKELLRILLSFHIQNSVVLPNQPTKTAA